MNKSEFLKNLNDLIKDIPEGDKKDILYDYSEHFVFGLSEGRTEEEIARSIGDPEAIAKEIIAEYKINNAERNTSSSNVFTAVLATLGLGLFNSIFIVGPFFAVVGAIIAFYASGGAIVISGIALFIGTFLEPILPQFFFIPTHPAVTISASIGLTALGLLWIIGTTYLTKVFYRITLKYLKMNINIIRRNKNEA